MSWDAEYTVWFNDISSKRLEFLDEKKMREAAKHYDFDPEQVIDQGESWIWSLNVEPYDNPRSRSDDVVGGCFKSNFEFVVYHYDDPSKTSNHGFERDVFEDEKEAWEFALEKAREGYFGVSVQVDETTKDGTNCNVDSLGCPYIELDIDEELQELIYRREEVELNLCEPECLQEWRYEELQESLKKLNLEIQQITASADGLTRNGVIRIKVPHAGLEVKV